jgi:outer membrane scaffolding protein for murein synthesis (MipA/OmpV family)
VNKRNTKITLTLGSLALSSAASATGVSGFVSTGVGVLPEYEGSSDTQTVPLAAGELRAGNRYLLLEGISLRANLVDSARWEAGPLVAYTFGRDADIRNTAVARLPALDDALEVGAFVARQWPGLRRERDLLRLSLQATTDATDVHNGWQVVPTVSYGTMLGERWGLRLDASATYASEKYMRTYFGVTAEQSRRSALARFNPDAGTKDVSLALFASYAVTSSWSIDGYVGARRLIGDAADSPIVADTGDATQLSIAIGIGRRF